MGIILMATVLRENLEGKQLLDVNFHQMFLVYMICMGISRNSVLMISITITMVILIDETFWIISNKKDNTKSYKVICDGSWDLLPLRYRSGSRNVYISVEDDFDIGFRLVSVPPQDS